VGNSTLSYSVPRELTDAEYLRFDSNATTGGSHPKYRRDWQTEADFDYWTQRNPRIAGDYTTQVADIDNHHIDDFIVENKAGRPIAVNGGMLMQSKYGPYTTDGLFTRLLSLRKAYKTMYSASLKSIRDDFKERVKPAYQTYISSLPQDKFHQHLNAKVVSDYILKRYVFDPLDAKGGLADKSPAEIARAHNTRVYKEAAEGAYKAWIQKYGGQLLNILGGVVPGLAGGAIEGGGGALYDQLATASAARGGKRARNTLYNEIVRAWSAVPDYLRGLVVEAITSGNIQTYVAALAAQDKQAAAAVAELIPLGRAAKDNGAPDFQ
jgi:hypothetical protein